ncbi:hypothetical protein BCT94_18800 [Vibrio breoganii]|nr:hypothetical protein BCT94_18800 [Vibrio breoganii]PML79949.1 hypothetical protein BCT68_15905 [Vibrio breoganii]
MLINKIGYLKKKLSYKIKLVLFFCKNYYHIMKSKFFLLSFLKFVSKYINLAVMFLPIKVFLLLSNDFSVPQLLDDFINAREYIIIILSFTALLYLINVVIQWYFSRLHNKKILKIEDSVPKLNFPKDLPLKLMKQNFTLTYNVVADFLTLSFSFCLFLYLSHLYAVVFITTLFMFSIVVEYLVFTENKYSFLDRLKLDSYQLIRISSALVYLVLFFSIFAIHLIEPFAIHTAVLLLFGSRLVNASIKDLLINTDKIKNNCSKNGFEYA